MASSAAARTTGYVPVITPGMPDPRGERGESAQSPAQEQDDSGNADESARSGEARSSAQRGSRRGSGQTAPARRRAPLRNAARKARRFPQLWSRSLLIRAVSFTGVLTLIGTGLVAAFLAQQVTTGLFQEQFSRVEGEATQGLVEIRNTFASAPSGDRTETETLVTNTLDAMQGSESQERREFILVPIDPTENLYASPQHSIDPDTIPDELAQTVAEGSGQYWQSVGIDRDGETVPGVAFGTQLTLPPGNAYALYFIYDFSSVQESLNFVLRVLLIAGIAILVMNMAIAAWVARSVVSPISQAAEVSERIAAGQLDQRLDVRGRDEIARLGVSFNKMASNLQDQITQLANLSKMQQRFVSDVSHELRTPLTTVSMAAAVLHESRDEFDPVNQRSAELLHHQVERFQALLADLLEMSRFDAGAAELAVSEVDLKQLCSEVLLTAYPLAEQSKTQLSLVVQGDDFIADVDPRRISRILRNLVNNAVEHSESRPVDLILASSPTAVGVAVRDHGIGMSPAEVSHVFHRFWRADPARARTTGGSGLGLSIATEDTRLHQGALDAWGQKGQGSCFRLVLPRSQEVPYRASPLALPPVYRATDRQHVSEEMIAEIGDAAGHDRVTEQALDQPKEETL